MKKLLIVALMLVASISLVGCYSNETLVNAEKDFYVTGQFAGWGDAVGNATYKMTPIAMNDERVKTVAKALKGATALYIIEVVINDDATWEASTWKDNVETKYDGNHCVKVVRTAVGDDVAEWWAQSPESGKINNLTPETLYIGEFVETSTGNGAWNDNPVVFTNGTYYIVYAEIGTARYLGAIAK